jgi:hypothetical protein
MKKGLFWIIFSYIIGGIFAYVHLKADGHTNTEFLYHAGITALIFLCVLFFVPFILYKFNFTLINKWYFIPEIYEVEEFSIYKILFMCFQIELWPRDLIE